MQKAFIFCLLIAVTPLLHASTLKNTTQFSSGSFADSLSLGYLTEPWALDVDYSYTSSQSPTLDELQALTTNAEYEFKNKILLGGGLNFSYSKTDMVTGFEPHITFGGIIDLGKGSEDFVPNLEITLDLGSNRLSQPSGLVTQRQILANRTKQLEITQKSVGLNFILSPLEWFNLKLSLVKYSYDKDVADFMSALSGSRFFVSRTSAFSNSISTLPSYMHELALTFYFLSKFSFKADFSVAQEAANGDKDQDISGRLGYDLFEDWNLALGLGQSTGASSTIGYGVAALTWHF